MLNSGSDTPDPVRNETTGRVMGPVVQARDIAGGVHFHQGVLLPPPNQLPLRPRMVDRESAIAELNAARAGAAGRSSVAVIMGPAGVGKTVLSVNWAHMISADFPGGQLYADLAGTATGPVVSPATVLGDFLFALGIPTDLIPGDPRRREALYHTLTQERPVLVVLDDARSAAQVRALLPASSASATVVTSRYRLTGLLVEGARGIYLDHLQAAPALALLADSLGDRVQRERHAAAELVELCAGHPLALSIAAARLAARPSWPLADMVSALAEEHQRLAALSTAEVAVTSALDQSYKALDPDAARLYRLLGLAPGATFGAAAASALAGISRIEAGRLLGVLTDANLLTDAPGGRYRFHNALIRLHGNQLAHNRGEDGDAAVRRLLGWYLDTAARAEQRLRPYRGVLPRDAEPPPTENADFESPRDALGWFEAERGNLRAAITVAYERGWHAMAWQLADAMWGLFLHRGHHGDRLLVEETGLAAARACRNRYAEAKMLNRLGLNRHHLGRHAQAADDFTHAHDLWEELGEAGRAAGSLRRLGWVAAALNDSDKAIASFAAASDAYGRLGDDRETALALVDLADVLIATDQAADALTHLDRARGLLAGIDDPHNQARVRMMAGRSRAAAGEHTLATRELHAATTTRRWRYSARPRLPPTPGSGTASTSSGFTRHLTAKSGGRRRWAMNDLTHDSDRLHQPDARQAAAEKGIS